MGGFQRKRKVYKLDFGGTEYDGLEVRVSGLTTGEYLDFVGLSAPGVEDEQSGTDTMLRMFAAHLLSWNLEDENGVPVPTDFEGLKTNDIQLNMRMIDAWTSALAEVPEATAKKSESGVEPLVVSIPTETL